jgi:hypothetical protein
MPKGLYELASGIDPNAIINIKLDTLERNNRFENSLNIPKYESLAMPEIKSFIPKDLEADDLLTRKDIRLPSLRDALLSDDPKIAEIAQEALRYNAQKNPISKGVGTTQYVPYTEGQNKFTNKNIFKGERNTMYGYNPYVSLSENEQFNHDNVWNSYSNFGKAWRGTGIFTGRVLSKLTTGLVGMVGDIGSMAWNGLQELGDVVGINNGVKNNFWDDVSNNWLSRKMEEADQHVKEQWLPTYKALNYDNKGAWSKLLDPYTWTNSFADGAGFLLQFAIPGTIFGKLGHAGKLARSIGVLEEAVVTAEATGDAIKVAKAVKTLEQAKNASRFTKAMGYEIGGKRAKGISEFLTGSDNVGGISAHIYNTSMEAVAETKETFNQSVKELMDKGISREKAVEIAGNNAPYQFLGNLAVLTASNAFENKLLQKAIGNRALRAEGKLGMNTLEEVVTPTTKFGKFFGTDKSWGNRLKFYGKNSAKAVAFEGFWEENAQTALSRWTAESYQRTGDDGVFDEKVQGGLQGLIKQYWKQTKDAIKGNDREAADSIMAGAVIGILGANGFSKFAGTRKEISRQIPLIDGNGEIMKDKDGKISYGKEILKPKTFFPESQRKLEIREKAQKVAEFTNKRDAFITLNDFDESLYDNKGEIIQEKLKEKTATIQEKLAKIDSVFRRTVTSETLLDVHQRDILKNEVFGDYVKAHILNNTGEALVDRLRDWNKADPNELAMYGVTPELQQDSLKWASRAEELLQAYRKAEDILYNAPKNESVSSYQSKTLAVRSLIFDYTSLKLMSEELAEKYKVLASENNPFAKYPQLQDYNTLQVRIKSLESQLSSPSISIIEREKVQEDLKDLQEQQNNLKQTISATEDLKYGSDGLVFPKDANIKAEMDNILNNYQDYFDFEHYANEHTAAASTYEKLIKDYSDPKTGLEKYNEVVDFWANKIFADQKAEEEAAETEEEKEKAKETKATLKLLKDNVANAKTEEERKAAEEALAAFIQEAKDAGIDIDETNTEDEEEADNGKGDKDLDETNEDLDEDPEEKQLASDSDTSEDLAYVTPFKTVNKETLNVYNDQGEVMYDRESVLTSGYDHDLTAFINEINNGDKEDKLAEFSPFVIKDTEELLKQRLSKKKLEELESGEFKPKYGAIVVFKHNVSGELLKFNTDKNKSIIAFSYNEMAFEDKKDERAYIKSIREKMSLKDAYKFYEEQQAIADTIRKMVIDNPSTEIPINISNGSLGVIPTSGYSENALERFKGYHNDEIVIVKDANDFPDGFEAGQVLLKIPSKFTYNKLDHYIPTFMGKISSESNSVIYNTLQALPYHKFDTQEEAATIVKTFLKGLFYTKKDLQGFRVVKDKDKFKIIYFRKDNNGKEQLIKSFFDLSPKVLEANFEGTRNFTYYTTDGEGGFKSVEMGNNEYVQFVKDHLVTRHKVMLIGKKGSEKIYTKPVNAYLNLTSVNDIDVSQGKAKESTVNSIVNNVVTPQNLQNKKKNTIIPIEKPKISLNFNITEENLVSSSNPLLFKGEYDKLTKDYENLLELIKCI